MANIIRFFLGIVGQMLGFEEKWYVVWLKLALFHSTSASVEYLRHPPLLMIA